MSDEPSAKRQALEADVYELRAAERRMQSYLGQHRRRESSMVLRLALKERENADLQQQIVELQRSHDTRFADMHKDLAGIVWELSKLRADMARWQVRLQPPSPPRSLPPSAAA